MIKIETEDDLDRFFYIYALLVGFLLSTIYLIMNYGSINSLSYIILVLIIWSFPSLLIAFVLYCSQIVILAIAFILFLIFKSILLPSKANTIKRRLVRLVLIEEEMANIIGDLLEEYNQIPSRLKANLWLYKQVITSIFPLIYRTLKSRLAARFGERIR
jgi:hypothetical protein